ncbi:hypothetical protein [Hydrogenimonas sp.]
MHNRFESLRQRCAKRRRKIFLKKIAVGLVTLGAAGGVLLYPWNGTVSIPASVMHGVTKNESEPVKKSVPVSSVKPEEKRVSMEAPAKEKEQVRRTVTGKEEKGSVEKSPRISSEATKRKESAVATAEISRLSKKRALPEKRRVASVKASPKKKRSLKKRESVKRKVVEASPSSSGKPRALLPAEAVKPVLEVKEVRDVDALVRQYDKFPRYATALKIANLHYEKGDYEKAALWARKANLIDRDDEAAWILYAKSEYALGNRERAKRILGLYLDYRDSIEARTLLLSWSGKETEGKRGKE